MTEAPLPLKGVRILDFTWAMAGPQATRLLADFGAEVLRIESRARPDLARTSFGPHPHGVDTFGLDSSGYFNHFNRNKKSINLNMRHPEAATVFEDLLRKADVVIENYSAGVLNGWGWPFERMKSIKPDIIYVSMAGPGHRGPYSSYRTFGPTVQALSGLTHLSGVPEDEPAGWGFSYMDHTGGYMAAIAVLMALYQREQSGCGEHVDLSQVEAAITLTGTALLDYQVNGRPSRRVGNRSPHPAAAPHGVYRCQDEDGRDRWLSIACYAEDQWRSLVTAMGDPAWATGEEFSTVQARQAHEDELDARIEAWTRPQMAHELMRSLQRAGVPAGVVQNHLDLTTRDEQVKHRGLFPPVRHPKLGEYLTDGLPMKLAATPGGVRVAAPLFGEHTREVLHEVLGYSEEKIDGLMASEALA
jgi:crotonobetainyl-CoA:carnitine CoA-transferase CaiB-like acyl-CoA transferase